METILVGMKLGVLIGACVGLACIALGALGGRLAGASIRATPAGPPWGHGSWILLLGGAGLGLLAGGAVAWPATPRSGAEMRSRVLTVTIDSSRYPGLQWPGGGMATRPRDVDDYLAGLSSDEREAREQLRAIIRSAAPDAEECSSYQLPAFRQNGYLISDSNVDAFTDELASYDTSKGAIRFTPDEPLPAPLVREVLKARLAENAARTGSRP